MVPLRSAWVPPASPKETPIAGPLFQGSRRRIGHSAIPRTLQIERRVRNAPPPPHRKQEETKTCQTEDSVRQQVCKTVYGLDRGYSATVLPSGLLHQRGLQDGLRTGPWLWYHCPTVWAKPRDGTRLSIVHSATRRACAGIARRPGVRTCRGSPIFRSRPSAGHRPGGGRAIPPAFPR